MWLLADRRDLSWPPATRVKSPDSSFLWTGNRDMNESGCGCRDPAVTQNSFLSRWEMHLWCSVIARPYNPLIGCTDTYPVPNTKLFKHSVFLFFSSLCITTNCSIWLALDLFPKCSVYKLMSTLALFAFFSHKYNNFVKKFWILRTFAITFPRIFFVAVC